MKKILIFKLSPIGDTVVFLPVVQALRKQRPDWRLTVVTTPAAAPLYRGWLPEDSLVVEERAHLHKSWHRPWTVLRRAARFRRQDAALLSFDQSSMARVIAWLSGARIRVGGSGSVVRFKAGLTHEIPFPEGGSVASWEWKMAQVMARALGQDLHGETAAPRVHAAGTPAAPAGARPRVMIHPGASRDYLRWGDERFEELARRLRADCDVEFVARPYRTLDELVAAVAAADLYVGNHSGAFHLAAAAGTRCVVLTSSAPHACDPPWNRDRIRILRRPELACQPCDALTFSPNRCTNADEPMACMRRWSVDAVERECRTALGLP